MDDMEQTKC